ncbi:MAG: HAD-IIIA family hydrolase [Opitutae bacterium]|nr:HAD-IIIA family hydrolase [Opitutae bacterium]
MRKDRRPAVFLDRDGTLNRPIVRDGKPFPPATLDEFALFDGVAEDCAKLKAAGFALVVATNQPDVGRGNQQQAVIESMHTRLLQLVPTLDRVEVCYDPGWGGIPSARRKPAPGMLLDAAQALDLDLARSWMIGDRAGDIEAGHAAGCRTIFIDWGYAEPPPAKAPHFAVKSFAAAAGIVLARS